MTKTRGPTTLRWPVKQLGDVVAIENQAIVPQTGESYRYVGLEHIEQQTGRIFDALEVDGRNIQSLKYVFAPFHILYGKLRPNLNKVALPTFSGICSTDILPLAAKGLVLRDFVAYYLRTPQFVHYAVQQASGTKMPRVGPQQLLKASLPVPPLPVQERIVQILQKADEVRHKRGEALDVADKILPSIFNQMFGDPTSNPKGYQRTTIGDVTSLVTSGYTPRGGARNYVEDGPCLIRSQNVRMLHLDLTDCARISMGTFEEMARVRIVPGDVLLNITGASIGRVAWADSEIPPACVNQHVCIIRAKKDVVAPEYLAYCLATPWYQHIILSAPGSAQTGFNHARVRALEMLVPPIPIQTAFVMQVQALRETRDKCVAAMDDAEKGFQGILALAFTGELTADWETGNADHIVAQQALSERVPRLLVLALLMEKVKHASWPGAEVLVTALMKYAFLLQMESNGGRRRLYHFVPYHYGPFAKELYSDLQALQDEGLVHVDNDSDEDRTKITVPDPARADLELTELPDDLKEDVATIIETYGNLDHNALLKAVYEKYPAYAKKSLLLRGVKRKSRR